MLLIGKPSISMGHLYHGYMLVYQSYRGWFIVWFTTLSPSHRDSRWTVTTKNGSIIGLSERGYGSPWFSCFTRKICRVKARLSRLNFEARKLPYLHVFWQIFRCEQSLKMSRCPSNSVGQIQVNLIWLSPAEIVLLKPLVYPLAI
jgi:hypothetical protein